MPCRAALLCLFLAASTCAAQETASPLRFSGAVSAPLNAKQMFMHALQAWRFTFGAEPGARMELDTASSTLHGSARFNFRSKGLNGREETMGPIAYRVRIVVRNGECQWIVEDFRHTGNKGAPRGGGDLGLLTNQESAPRRIPGMSSPSTSNVWKDAKAQVGDRIAALGMAFEARMRAAAEP